MLPAVKSVRFAVTGERSLTGTTNTYRVPGDISRSAGAAAAHADADADNKCDVCGYKMTAVSDTEDDTVDSEKTTGADKGTAADKGGLYAGAVIGIAAVAVIAVVIGMVIRKKKA